MRNETAGSLPAQGGSLAGQMQAQNADQAAKPNADQAAKIAAFRKFCAIHGLKKNYNNAADTIGFIPGVLVGALATIFVNNTRVAFRGGRKIGSSLGGLFGAITSAPRIVYLASTRHIAHTNDDIKSATDLLSAFHPKALAYENEIAALERYNTANAEFFALPTQTPPNFPNTYRKIVATYKPGWNQSKASSALIKTLTGSDTDHVKMSQLATYYTNEKNKDKSLYKILEKNTDFVFLYNLHRVTAEYISANLGARVLTWNAEECLVTPVNPDNSLLNYIIQAIRANYVVSFSSSAGSEKLYKTLTSQCADSMKAAALYRYVNSEGVKNCGYNEGKKLFNVIIAAAVAFQNRTVTLSM